MTIVDIIDRITAWADENICKKVYLKEPPPDNDEPDDADYEYKRVNPVCLAMYVPSREKLPPRVASPIPSLCVRCVGGTDAALGMRYANMEFCFSTWETGTNGRDILIPDGKNGLLMREWSGEEAEKYFRRHGGGWRDLWNFVDTALRELESVGNLNGVAIDKSRDINFEPLKEQESIVDLHPFWFATVGFTVKTSIIRNNQDYEKFL